MGKNGVMVNVYHVTIRFNLANQKVDNLKERAQALSKSITGLKNK